mmetsp:Transcript_15933/g.55393  ORF Transcript_15933/g.55393 Transcript_15933/m.55393 type:complete len:252 (-) Transcript_15933:97-852(-)
MHGPCKRQHAFRRSCALRPRAPPGAGTCVVAAGLAAACLASGGAPSLSLGFSVGPGAAARPPTSRSGARGSPSAAQLGCHHRVACLPSGISEYGSLRSQQLVAVRAETPMPSSGLPRAAANVGSPVAALAAATLVGAGATRCKRDLGKTMRRVKIFDATKNFGESIDVYSSMFAVFVIMIFALWITPFFTYFNKPDEEDDLEDDDDNDLAEEEELLQRQEKEDAEAEARAEKVDATKKKNKKESKEPEPVG